MQESSHMAGGQKNVEYAIQESLHMVGGKNKVKYIQRIVLSPYVCCGYQPGAQFYARSR